MTPKNQELRDSLKQIETTITSALAHQPEDDAQCGQFLYDTLVTVFNAADLATHKREIDELTYAYDPTKAAKLKAPDPVEYAIEGFKRDPDIMRMYEKSAVGDAAKLREAFANIAEYAQSARCYTEDVYVLDYLYRIEELAQSALSAPPRNCDVARDWVRDLYAHFQPPASIKREMPPEWVDSVMAFCRWLVAPATEKKRGNDGNE